MVLSLFLIGVSGAMISQVQRRDPALLQYARQSFGTINLSEEDWKKCEDHYKVLHLLPSLLLLSHFKNATFILVNKISRNA